MIKENSNRATIEVNGKEVTFSFYNYEKLTLTQQKLIYSIWAEAMANHIANREERDGGKAAITWGNLVAEGIYQSKEEAREKFSHDYRAFQNITRKATLYEEENGTRETIEQQLFRGAYDGEDGAVVDVNVRFCELSIAEMQIFSMVEGLRLTPDETGKFFHGVVGKCEHAPKKRVSKSQTENLPDDLAKHEKTAVAPQKRPKFGN